MSKRTKTVKARANAALAIEHGPYRDRIGSAYLDRAWREGAEHGVTLCLALIEEDAWTSTGFGQD